MSSDEVDAMTSQTSQTAPNSANATGILLRDLIDYAGLFPPASLPMASAVANYDKYSRSEWNWMLGRFIVPVVRLNEFEAAFNGLPTSDLPTLDLPTSDSPTSADGRSFANWRLSALLGSDPVADVARLREFDMRRAASSSARKAVVESVEVKITSAEQIAQFSKIIPEEFATYFEMPLPACGECLGAVAAAGGRAKIRTGGETADKFPAPDSVIEFISQCAAASVPFKATAGLHHPLRSVHRLNYQPDSPSGLMHGFLNIFLAAAFLRNGMEAKLAIQLLEEQSARSFQLDSQFDSDGIAWREHRLSRDKIAAARAGFAISFGSCSFIEPIDDLRSLHLL